MSTEKGVTMEKKVLSDEVSEKIVENEDKKQDLQRYIAGGAFLSIVALMAYLAMGGVELERISALSNAIEMYYLTMSGIVATFFGAEAFLASRK